MSVIMKRQITAGLAILAVTAGVGWKLAHHPERSAGLQHIKLVPHSEHSSPGPGDVLAGIRIRLSPSDFNDQMNATKHAVPQIPIAPQ